MNERQVANKALELADELEAFHADPDGFPYMIGEAITMLRSQEKYINLLHRLCNANGIGAGKDLLTGEVIPFEVNE